MTGILILLLVLPVCSCKFVASVDVSGARSGADLVWIIYRVDSLNVGDLNHPDCHRENPRFIYEDGNQTRFEPGDLGCGEGIHEWVYSPERFKSEAQLPPANVKEPWTERERERICRICLRREWQAQKMIPPKSVLSPFDSLKARLRSAGGLHVP